MMFGFLFGLGFLDERSANPSERGTGLLKRITSVTWGRKKKRLEKLWSMSSGISSLSRTIATGGNPLKADSRRCWEINDDGLTTFRSRIPIAMSTTSSSTVPRSPCFLSHLSFSIFRLFSFRTKCATIFNFLMCCATYPNDVDSRREKNCLRDEEKKKETRYDIEDDNWTWRENHVSFFLFVLLFFFFHLRDGQTASYVS